MEANEGESLSSDSLSASHFGSAGDVDSSSGFKSDQRLLNEEQNKVAPEVVKPFKVDIILDEKVEHGRIYDLLYVKEERNFILATLKGVCVMHMNLKTGSLSERYFLPTRCKTYTIYRGKAKDRNEESDKRVGRYQRDFNDPSNNVDSNETSISSVPKQLRVRSSTFLVGLQRGSIAKFTTHGAKKGSYIRFMREIHVGFGPIVKICEAPDRSVLAFSSSGCVSRINDDSADTGRLTKDCSIFGAVVIKGRNVGNSRIYVASSASVVPIYKPTSSSKMKEQEKTGKTISENSKSSNYDDTSKTSKSEMKDSKDDKVSLTGSNKSVKEGETLESIQNEGGGSLSSDDNVFMRVKAILGNKSAGVPSAMTGHDASIRDIIQVEVPTDDILIATASADKSIGLWHVATRVPISVSKKIKSNNHDSSAIRSVGKTELNNTEIIERNNQNEGGLSARENEKGNDDNEFKKNVFSARLPDKRLKEEEMITHHEKLNFTPTSTYLIGLYTAHLKPIVSIAYSKRLRLLFAGSKDGTISIWYLGKTRHVDKNLNNSEDLLKLDEKDKKRAEFLMYGHVGVFKLTLVEKIKVSFRLKKVFVIDTGFADVLAAICGSYIKIYEVALNPKFSHLLSEPF